MHVCIVCWCVRALAGKLGNYYTGAYKLYHLRVGANDTDKNALDLVLRYLCDIDMYIMRTEMISCPHAPSVAIIVTD